MTRFVVLEPEGAPEKSERAVFVPDGFRFLALLLPVAWLLWHRLWLAAASTLAASLLLGWLGEQAGLRAAVLPLLVHGLVALEGPALRVRRLTRRGFREVAAVHARGRADAEILYFADPSIAVAAPERPADPGAPNLLMPAAPPRPGGRRPFAASRTLLDAPGR